MAEITQTEHVGSSPARPEHYFTSEAERELALDFVQMLRPFIEGLRAPFEALAKSIEPDEIQEFKEGARALFHRQVDLLFDSEDDALAVDQSLRELVEYAESWALSVRLSANSEWLEQMDESRELRAEPPVSLEELRNRLAV